MARTSCRSDRTNTAGSHSGSRLVVSSIILGAILCATPAAAAAPGSSEATVSGPRWTVVPGVEVAVSKPIRTAAVLFSTATDFGLSASLTRTGARWRLPISLWYRRALDSEPATGVFFVGAWALPEVTFLRRITASVGLGWQWRHIDIDGVASTRGSMSAMTSVGVRFRPSTRVELTAVARYDTARAVDGEGAGVEHLGLGLSLALLSP